MSDQNVFLVFNTRFRSVSRPDREKLLCAMIRVNYGTPWDGDVERLRAFFPDWHHRNLTLGGLTQLIEALSPFSDEPTQSGISLLVGESTSSNMSEITASLGEATSDIPKGLFEETQSLKMAL